MIVYRALGAIGRMLISAGVIILAFVAYQLWGTKLHTNAAQARLGDQLDRRIAQIQQIGDEEGRTANGPSGREPREMSELVADRPRNGSSAEDGSSRPRVDPRAAEAILASVKGGEPIGRIAIPEIDSEWVIVEGVDLSWLRNGPGHFPGTSFPGQRGNSALAGHRTTYGAPFHRLDELEPGDLVEVETVQGRFTYRVLPLEKVAAKTPPLRNRVGPENARSAWFVVEPHESWILDDFGDDRLTLMACHPKYSARQRIVAVAELTDEPARRVLPPRDAATAQPPEEAHLLGGDPSAKLPALAWAVAAGSIWFMAWAVGRRLGKWRTYFLCFPAFAVTLFVCFTYVERLLPAAY